jgi:DNA-binding FadR family transcriptional regulator
VTALLRPMDQTRRSSAVATQIKSLVLQGRYKPGDKLPSERDLARHLKVGRPTVREAIQQLQGLGVIEVRPAKGIFVRSLTPGSLTTRLKRIVEDEIRMLVQVVDVRIVLEGWVAAEAARRATPQELAQIAELAQALAQASDPETLFDHHLAFHQAVLQASHNVVVLHMLDTLTSLIASVSKEEAAHVGHEPRFHLAIAEAIVARDPVRAEQAMADHLKAARQTLLDAAVTLGP